MKARFFAIGGLAVILVVAVVALWSHLDREPQHDGRPLSYWLDQALTGEFREGILETFSALKAIGPPAARCLVHDLAITDPPLRRYYAGLRSKLPASVNAVLPHSRLPVSGARGNAFCALGHMGREARGEVPELIRLLSHPDTQVRIYAAMVLAGIGPEAKPAVPILLSELSNNLDQQLSNCFSQAMSRIEGQPQTRLEE
jgi:HEAT repeat protein